MFCRKGMLRVLGMFPTKVGFFGVGLVLDKPCKKMLKRSNNLVYTGSSSLGELFEVVGSINSSGR